MWNLIRRLWYSSLRRTRTVYKVVRQSKYRSVIAYGKAEVEYEVGEWTTAPEWLATESYHPLCFESLEEAHRAIQEFDWGTLPSDIAIWKVSARGVVSYDSMPPICIGWYLDHGELSPCGVGWESWPQGTIMAKAVRLEEKVWDSKEDV